MTAKELKALLANVSDDMEIHIRIEPTGNEVKATETTQVIRPGGLSLFIVNGVLGKGPTVDVEASEATEKPALNA